MPDPLPTEYGSLLREVRERIRSAQYEALRAVNRELIALYWDIGRLIVERQSAASWGRSVVEVLARDLRAELPGLRGFSARNIWYMRELYVTYQGNEILQPLVAEVAWSHNLVIMTHCRDDAQREFYLRMTRQQGWSKNVLIHQIENRSFEKTVRSQTSFDRTLPVEMRMQAKLAVRDEYTFDFLELADVHSERQLEGAILARVEPFLREMGGVFAFIGSQHRLEVGGQEFFIDLLLHHRRLRCLVAVELKVGDFIPEYVGKMQFYLAALDDLVRMPEENPSIGIILCKSRNRTIVEYALRESNKPISVAGYRLVSRLPAELEGQLPAPEQVARLMDGVRS